MRVFVMRPFGTKEGISFDEVHDKLIAPAIEQLGYRGGTTGETTRSGSIHEVMFLEIIDADLVIADVSIHSANVFYELGIRHALRSRSTVLIRARRVAPAARGGVPEQAAADESAESVPAPTKIPEIPFDIHGLRYVDYDPDRPNVALATLVDAISATLLAGATDSPVYQRFPELETRTDGWNRVPLALQEQIESSREDASRGDLRMLAEDVLGAPFEVAAMRLIAAAQLGLGDRDGARASWEFVRSQRPNDYEANHALATIYAKAGLLTKSDQAIERARFRHAQLAPAQLAELHGLAASNLKSRWQAHFSQSKEVDERRRRALVSSLLTSAFDEYLAGYRLDLGSYYTGLNALALARIRLDLASLLPDDWRCLHDDDDEARAARDALRQRCDGLKVAVGTTLDACAERLGGDSIDRWLPVSRADYRFLTCDDPDRVVAAYVAAAHGLGEDLSASVNRQIEIFQQLGLRTTAVDAVRAASATVAGSTTHVIVFSGHALDGPEPAEPRFPPESCDAVRAALRETVERIVRSAGKRAKVVAFAAGSDGGDLLFHHVCQDLAQNERLPIERELFLPFPASEFQAKGISRGVIEPYWMQLFAQARSGAKVVRVLDEQGDRPSWTGQRPGATSWDRWPRWALHHAVARVSAERVTALVLWDGVPAVEDDEEHGGVRGFVRQVQLVGVPLEMIILRAGKIVPPTSH
jgi:hypothetical protein